MGGGWEAIEGLFGGWGMGLDYSFVQQMFFLQKKKPPTNLEPRLSGFNSFDSTCFFFYEKKKRVASPLLPNRRFADVDMEKKKRWSLPIFRPDVIGKSLGFYIFVLVVGVRIVGRADVVHLEHVAASRTPSDGAFARHL